MEWLGTVLSNLLTAAVVATVSWWIARRKSRRNAAVWKLEFVREEEWTLQRVADRPALDVAMYMTNELGAPGFDMQAWSPDPGLDRVGKLHIDLRPGATNDVKKVPHGMSLTLTWIESDVRWKAYVRTRVGIDVYTLTAGEAMIDPY